MSFARIRHLGDNTPLMPGRRDLAIAARLHAVCAFARINRWLQKADPMAPSRSRPLLEDAKDAPRAGSALREPFDGKLLVMLINGIQKGMAARMEFQAIVDMVGDKLRELFDSGDLNIVWWDDKTNLVQVLYRYEHNRPLPLPHARPLKPDGFLTRILLQRETAVANTREDQTRVGVGPAPGTDWAHSIVAVPIIGS